VPKPSGASNIVAQTVAGKVAPGYRLRKHGISPATFYKFKAKYGGMDALNWATSRNELGANAAGIIAEFGAIGRW